MKHVLNLIITAMILCVTSKYLPMMQVDGTDTLITVIVVVFMVQFVGTSIVIKSISMCMHPKNGWAQFIVGLTVFLSEFIVISLLSMRMSGFLVVGVVPVIALCLAFTLLRIPN